MQANDKNTDCIKSVHLINSRTISTRFDLEPWGEQFEIPPGEKFIVVANGPEHGDLEVEFTNDRITVFGWVGSTVAVFHNGIELGGEFGKRPPIPPTPKSKFT